MVVDKQMSWLYAAGCSYISVITDIHRDNEQVRRVPYLQTSLVPCNIKMMKGDGTTERDPTQSLDTIPS